MIDDDSTKLSCRGGEAGGVAGRPPGEHTGMCLLGIAAGVPRDDVLSDRCGGGVDVRLGMGIALATAAAMLIGGASDGQVRMKARNVGACSVKHEYRIWQKRPLQWWSSNKVELGFPTKRVQWVTCEFLGRRNNSQAQDSVCVTEWRGDGQRRWGAIDEYVKQKQGAFATHLVANGTDRQCLKMRSTAQGWSRKEPSTAAVRRASTSLKRGSRCAQHLVERGEGWRDAK